jgi:ADP-heptose:LPS heptosyltransferase
MEKNKVLVYCDFGIGNVLFQLPFLYSLKHEGGYHVECVCNANNPSSALLEKISFVDKVIKIKTGKNRWLGRIRFFISLSKTIIGRDKFVIRFHNSRLLKVITFFFRKKCIGHANFYNSEISASRYYSNSITSDFNNHEIMINLDLSKLFKLSGKFEKNSFRIEAIEQAKILEDADILIHVGSSQKQNWKRPSVELVKPLLERYSGSRIIFIGTSDEYKDTESFIRQIKEGASIVNLCGKLTLIELGALMRKSNMVIGGDSFPIHFAAALGVKTIGIYGPTDWKRTYPFSSHSKLVRMPCKCNKDGALSKKTLKKIAKCGGICLH